MGNFYFDEMVKSFSKLEQVDAILLAGSRAVQADDELSDYDVYIYTSNDIPVEVRKEITDQYCSYMEINNQYWETEDDGVLKDGTEIELIYRNIDWLDKELNRVVNVYQASTGYSTCFWYNLLNSKVLYERDGKAGILIDKYSVSYPGELKRNIISKNYPLLNSSMPAYRNQIKKALARNDIISVNHRIAEFIASYFDIVFAINEMPHPGEKKLINIALHNCNKLPELFEHNLTALLLQISSANAADNKQILSLIDEIVERLTQLLVQEGLAG
ncbi:hypothetical protein C942_01988 [Photobacterium marinum]|uniref:Uncharacterized protein n=1 Tax=Photobacterium marinum TaxID=1056511 RepID=L8J9L2_9GAMM|nr:DUF4037 domain-containing protein [Photobacterium marinum]ELR64898.1 hypothetical protein C942_01988 [Photobacterium marinum]